MPFQEKCDACLQETELHFPFYWPDPKNTLYSPEGLLEYERLINEYGTNNFFVCAFCFLKSLNINKKGEKLEDNSESN